MKRRIVGASLCVFASFAVFAQNAEKPQAFEVASVRAAPKDAGSDFEEGRRMGRASRGIVIEGRRVTITYNSLKDLVRLAYRVKDHQVVAAPWMTEQKFDLAASIPEGADVSQAPEMLQALLAERFHLKAHWEPKEMPVYALIVGKNGLKSHETDPKPPASAPAGGGSVSFGGGPRHIRMKAVPVERLVDFLTRITDRPVIDKTELTAKYDFDFTFASDDSAADSAPSIYTAVQEQLGLKLEARKASVKTIVVDQVDKLPTEN